ncbi:hypothetical protein [Labilibaculum manganireducens]|uniref:hypothetical protein n=1 Tax=Labilibaculum manganireducens TaxID=1940525 RepID=UPI0029F4DE8C|nr:hypothetical protein [Labilibaculum manganireducens]
MNTHTKNGHAMAMSLPCTIISNSIKYLVDDYNNLWEWLGIIDGVNNGCKQQMNTHTKNGHAMAMSLRCTIISNSIKYLVDDYNNLWEWLGIIDGVNNGCKQQTHTHTKNGHAMAMSLRCTIISNSIKYLVVDYNNLWEWQGIIDGVNNGCKQQTHTHTKNGHAMAMSLRCTIISNSIKYLVVDYNNLWEWLGIIDGVNNGCKQQMNTHTKNGHAMAMSLRCTIISNSIK